MNCNFSLRQGGAAPYNPRQGSSPALWTPRTPIGLLSSLADCPPPFLNGLMPLAGPYLYCTVLSIRAMDILTL